MPEKLKEGATQPNSDPNDPASLGPAIDTDQNRVISANWFQGRLVAAFNDDFKDPDNVGNNNLVRTGFRIDEVDTTNNNLLADVGWRTSAYDFYYPAVTLDRNANIDVIFGFSAEDVYPSLVAWTLSAACNNNSCPITSETVLDNGESSSVALDDLGRNRYGDYFGAAVDPVDPSDVWVAGEYHSLPGGEEYSTAIAAITAPPPGSPANIPQNAVWSGWVSLGHPPGPNILPGPFPLPLPGNLVVVGHPVVAKNVDGRLEVFVRGSNNALYHRVQIQPGSKDYSPYESLGGPVSSDPAVAPNADGRLEVFVRGRDGFVYHKAQISSGNTQYTKWSRLITATLLPNIRIIGTPAVAKNADGRLDVFSIDNRGNVYHNPQSAPGSTQYAGWSLIGGGKEGNPTVAQDADGKLNVFVHGLNDNLLYEKRQAAPNSNTYSSNWIPLGGDLKHIGSHSLDHAVATNADGRLELYAVFNNNDLYHKYQLSLQPPPLS